MKVHDHPVMAATALPGIAHVTLAGADDGLRQVRAGLTSLDELMRIVDLTDRM